MKLINIYRNNLTTNGFFFILNLFGFAVGIAVTLLILLYSKHEYSYDKDYINYKQIFQVYDSTEMDSDIDYNFCSIAQDRYPEIINSAPLNNFQAGWKIEAAWKDNPPVKLKFASTTNQFFEIFAIDFIAGNSQNALADKNSAVITESTANQIFGNVNPLGQQLELWHEHTVTISAVIKDFPSNSSIQTSLILNAENTNFRFSMRCENGDCWNLMGAYLLLKKGTSAENLVSKINNEIASWNVHCESIGLQKLEDVYLNDSILVSDHKKGSRVMIYILLFIALLILAMSIVNQVNSQTSIQLSKIRNIAIKKINGASKKNLLSDILFETFTNTLIVYILALLLIYTCYPLAATIMEVPIKPIWLLERNMILLQVALFLFLLALQGLPHYLIVNNSDTLTKLKNVKGQPSSKIMLNRSLSVFQFVISISLIICALTIRKQVEKIKHAEWGFDKEQVLKIDIPQGYSYERAKTLKEAMQQYPGVLSAGISQGTPGSINMHWGSNHESNKSIMVATILCDNEYIETLDFEIIHGRGFRPSDKGNSCLITETTFQEFGWESFEGRVIDNNRPGGYHIIGVVKDFHVQSFHKEIEPTILVYEDEFWPMQLSLKLQTKAIPDVLKELEAFWEQNSNDFMLEFSFYDTWFESMYQSEERTAKTLSYFTIIALLITCLGILSQAHRMSQLRIKEVGIRKVNGAKIIEVLGLLNKGLIIRIILAFLCASPIAFYLMNKWLETFAYKIDLSWEIFTLAGLVTLLIAFLTVSWHTWFTATKNPVEALRYE